jgi:hypothetical protein
MSERLLLGRVMPLSGAAIRKIEATCCIRSLTAQQQTTRRIDAAGSRDCRGGAGGAAGGAA